MPNLLNQLHWARGILEGILKSLDSFLESMRRGFARFYFLSDGELLGLLSKMRDHERFAVGCLHKLFEGVRECEFQALAEKGELEQVEGALAGDVMVRGAARRASGRVGGGPGRPRADRPGP